MKTLEETNAKLHEKIFNLEETAKSMKQSTGVCIIHTLTHTHTHTHTHTMTIKNCCEISLSYHQHLQDEHSELQLEYNAQEKKKKYLETENDRLVSV